MKSKESHGINIYNDKTPEQIRQLNTEKELLEGAIANILEKWEKSMQDLENAEKEFNQL